MTLHTYYRLFSAFDWFLDEVVYPTKHKDLDIWKPWWMYLSQKPRPSLMPAPKNALTSLPTTVSNWMTNVSDDHWNNHHSTHLSNHPLTTLGTPSNQLLGDISVDCSNNYSSHHADHHLNTPSTTNLVTAIMTTLYNVCSSNYSNNHYSSHPSNQPSDHPSDDYTYNCSNDYSIEYPNKQLSSFQHTRSQNGKIEKMRWRKNLKFIITVYNWVEKLM